MARKPNPLDDPPAVSSSEEQHHEEEEEEEEDDEEVEEAGEEEDDEPNAQRDGSESEEVEEEEEEEEEEEDEDDDDKEELPKQNKVNPQPSQSKPLVKNPNSDDEEDDDETESDSDPRSPGASAFTIRKHVASPAVGTPNSAVSVKPKKPAEKPSISNDGDLSPELLSLKRPAESGLKESKSKKAKSENGGGEAKKSAINRLWSEKDEIVVLEGMIRFHEERGKDPNSDSTELHEFLKSDLSVDASKSQLIDKIRRLKKKYRNNVGKGEGGEDPVFSRPHEHKSFHLSKKIWGGGLAIPAKRPPSKKKVSVKESAKRKPAIAKNNGNVNGGLVMDLPKNELVLAVSNKKEQDKVQDGSFSDLYPFLSLAVKSNNFCADLISKDGAKAMEGCLRCLDKSKLDELEREWKKQALAEADVQMKRAALLQKQVQLVADWHSRSG